MWTKFKNFPSNVKTQLLSVLTMTLSCLLGGEKAMDRPMVKVKLFGSKNEENFLYDSGAQVSLMSKRIFRKIKVNLRPEKINFNLTCSGVSGNKLKVMGCYFFNFKGKKKFQGGAKPKNQGGQLKCYYCNKTGHFKSNCITMKNDRKKGIFKSNINASQKPRFMNPVDADESDSDDGATPDVGNCQTDIANLLNFHIV